MIFEESVEITNVITTNATPEEFEEFRHLDQEEGCKWVVEQLEKLKGA